MKFTLYQFHVLVMVRHDQFGFDVIGELQVGTGVFVLSGHFPNRIVAL